LNAEFFCVSCRTAFLNEHPLDLEGRCSLCRLGMNGFDAAYSFGLYEKELRQLIHLFKYGRVQTLAKPLGRMLASALPRDEQFDVLVPMPMHWLRRWQRGFNQAELLADELGRRTHLKVRNAVKRVHHKKAQAGLTNAKRRLNVAAAFRVRNVQAIQGRRVLLVDDVMTTGATASACARVLKRAGAAHVSLLTVGRVDRRIAVMDSATSSATESTLSGSFEHAKSGSFA
jgi:ComF family protein